MKEYRFRIPGQLPGLNEYTYACRNSRYTGARMKKEAEELIMYCIRTQIGHVNITGTVHIVYWFAEPNRKRDIDNICGFATKVIHDSIVRCGLIKDDSQKYLRGFTPNFTVDKDDPHITVLICEEEEEADRHWQTGGCSLVP